MTAAEENFGRYESAGDVSVKLEEVASLVQPSLANRRKLYVPGAVVTAMRKFSTPQAGGAVGVLPADVAGVRRRRRDERDPVARRRRGDAAPGDPRGVPRAHRGEADGERGRGGGRSRDERRDHDAEDEREHEHTTDADHGSPPHVATSSRGRRLAQIRSAAGQNQFHLSINVWCLSVCRPG